MFRVVNNWERLEYFFNDTKLDPNEIVKLGVVCDGTIRLFDVVCKRTHKTYMDQGHTYGVNRDELFVIVDLMAGTELIGSPLKVEISITQLSIMYSFIYGIGFADGKTMRRTKK